MVTDSCVEYAMYGDVQCAGAQGGQIELAPSQQCSDTLLCLPTLISASSPHPECLSAPPLCCFPSAPAFPWLLFQLR